MTKQNQSASSDSVALQSGRDTHVTNVTVLVRTEAQMWEVLNQLAGLKIYAADGQDIASERKSFFSGKLVGRFLEDGDARKEAFADPDFQHVLRNSQDVFARSGEQSVADLLVGIIVRRSQETSRTRLALSLNEAVEKAAHLTPNEFAALSLAFAFRFSQHPGIENLAQLGAHLQKIGSTMLPDVTDAHSCYGYLETQSCASVGFGGANFEAVLHHAYPGVLSPGFERTQLDTDYSAGVVDQLVQSKVLVPSVNDASRLQPRALNIDVYQARVKEAAVDKEVATKLWDQYKATLWKNEELIERSEPHFALVRPFKEKWDDTTPLAKLTLTTVGYAIAHANLKRLGIRTGDLKTWIP